MVGLTILGTRSGIHLAARRTVGALNYRKDFGLRSSWDNALEFLPTSLSGLPQG